MTQLSTVHPQTGLQPVQNFSREQIDLLKRTVATDHTDDELSLFLAYCKSRKLDPFAREVYSVKRKGKVTFQTGIDGARKLAEATGEYDGQDVAWCGADGQWVDVWLNQAPPAAAKVTAYRLGRSKPFVGIAKWDEYKPAENDFMWQKMPANQLAKCAEALALRKAFPGQLGGLYVAEEMKQADKPIVAPRAIEAEEVDMSTGEIYQEAGTTAPVVEAVPTPAARPPSGGSSERSLSPKQQAFLFGLSKKKGWNEDDVKAYTRRFFNKQDPTKLTSRELDTAIQYLRALADASPDK